MEKRLLLDRIASDEEERLLLGGVMDKYERCRRRNVPVTTAFLSLAQQSSVRRLLQSLGAPEDSAVFYGGYDGAERRQAHFLPEWQSEPDRDAVVCLRASFYEPGALTHRDILGSLMGMGLTRQSIGDILVAEKSADIFVCAAAAEALLREWNSAGRVALQVRAVAPEEVSVPPQRTKELRDTVASLRLDSVLSVGFSVSRGKAAEAVARGRVQVNGSECLKPDRQVATGDVLSVRGLGKCRLSCVGGKTKKDRVFITVERYL